MPTTRYCQPTYENVGISGADNGTFLRIIVATFSVAERNAWGSTFLHAEKAGWISPQQRRVPKMLSR